jgi:hypothetical protein
MYNIDVLKDGIIFLNYLVHGIHITQENVMKLFSYLRKFPWIISPHVAKFSPYKVSFKLFMSSNFFYIICVTLNFDYVSWVVILHAMHTIFVFSDRKISKYIANIHGLTQNFLTVLTTQISSHSKLLKNQQLKERTIFCYKCPTNYYTFKL